MPQTYKWQDAVDFAEKMTKGTPMSTLDVRICDMVSSEIWNSYAWFISKTTIAPGTLPLVDGIQDYDAPVNIYTLTKAALVYKSTTPYQYRELDVTQEEDINLVRTDPNTIRSISLQAGVGKLRLEAAAAVTAGYAWEIQGEYKTNPSKVTALTDQLWFDDQFLMIAVEGLVYWAYKIADDKRAGGTQTQGGRIVYTGKYADFRAGIDRMKFAEDFGGVDGVFPYENLSQGRDGYYPSIYGVINS